MDFAQAFLDRLHTDRVIINTSFFPMEVQGKHKPRLLRELVFGSNRLQAYAVYTDSIEDLSMLEEFAWSEVGIVVPDRLQDQSPDHTARKMGNHLLEKMAWECKDQGWTVIPKDELRRDLPHSVRDYAASVICGEGDYASLREAFYRRILGRMEEYKLIPDIPPAALRDILGGVGLYLTEPESVRENLVPTLGADFDASAFRMYGELVARDPKEHTPLNLIK